MLDGAGKGVQEGGLARAGAAGNHGGDAALDRAVQEFGDAGRHRADGDQALQVVGLLGELPDRDGGAVDGDRGDGGVHAAAVRKASVDHRRAFVDPPAHGGDDAVDDAQEVVVVAEADGREFELAVPLDVDLERPVDQDVGDRVVLQQGLDRPQTHHLVEDVGAQFLEFGAVQRQPLLAGEVADQLAHLAAHLLLVELVELREVDLVDQPRVQLEARIQKAVFAEEGRVLDRLRGWRGGRSRRRRGQRGRDFRFDGGRRRRRGGLQDRRRGAGGETAHQAARPRASAAPPVISCSTMAAMSLTIFERGRCWLIGPPRLAEQAAASQSDVMTPSTLRPSAFSASPREGAGPNMRPAMRFRSTRGCAWSGSSVSISDESARAASSAGTVSSETTRIWSEPASRSMVHAWRPRGRSTTIQSYA